VHQTANCTSVFDKHGSPHCLEDFKGLSLDSFTVFVPYFNGRDTDFLYLLPNLRQIANDELIGRTKGIFNPEGCPAWRLGGPRIGQ